MLLRRLIIVAVFSSFGTTQALGQEVCSPAAIQAKPKVTLLDAISKFSKVSLQKDEFETTAAFQARVAAAQAQFAGGDLLFAFGDSVSTEFNADLGQVTVPGYALSGTCLVNEHSLSAEMKLVAFGKPGRFLSTPYCMTEAAGTADLGSYEATNGYGAKVTVEKSSFKSRGIFFGVGDSGQSLFGGRRAYSKDPVFVFEATVPEARSLKQNAQLLVLGTPRAPFAGAGTYYSKPTFDKPRETTFSTDFIVATPLCVAIADKVSGKVFAARAIAVDAGSPR